MKYNYKIEIDCPNCAAKVEHALKKVDGIDDCVINFFASKMTIETENEMTDELYEKIVKTAKKKESGFKLSLI